MSEPSPDTMARLRAALDRVQPGDTLILAHHDSDGGVVTYTLGCDPAPLVDTARTLLDQALDRLEAAPATAENRRLMRCTSAALEELPDPHAEEDDEGDSEQ